MLTLNCINIQSVRLLVYTVEHKWRPGWWCSLFRNQECIRESRGEREHKLVYELCPHVQRICLVLEHEVEDQCQQN